MYVVFFLLQNSELAELLNENNTELNTININDDWQAGKFLRLLSRIRSKEHA